MPGETNATLTLTNLQLNQSGAYSVSIANDWGEVESVPCPLSVGLVAAWGSNFRAKQIPPNLTNVAAIAAGADHCLALRTDGRVLAWGDNDYGQIEVPPGLSNVVAISAGEDHSLALTSEGRVTAWGRYYSQVTNLPPTLSNVVAIAAGTYHNIALKADGTAIAWGDNWDGQNVPFGLSNLVAIAAGREHSLAIRADGHVVAWGRNTFGQTNVPPTVSNVVAIAAGTYHSVALAGDGTVFAWGRNDYGQTNLETVTKLLVAIASGGANNLGITTNSKVTAWGLNAYDNEHITRLLTNVVAVAQGCGHGLALMGDGPPRLSAPLMDRTIRGGATVQLRAPSTGLLPLSYQWQFNGVDLPGATNAVLSLTNVQPAQGGYYSLTVSNTLGVASSSALLTVAPLLIITPPSGTGSLERFISQPRCNNGKQPAAPLSVAMEWLKLTGSNEFHADADESAAFRFRRLLRDSSK